jgi:hypothetical protein
MEAFSIKKEIKKIAIGYKVLEKKLIEAAILQTSQKLLLIESCLKSHNWEELKEITHFFKSNFLALNLPKTTIELMDSLRTISGIDVEKTKMQTQELVNICR